MRLRAVFSNVGETLVDEDGYWRRVARLAGVPRHVVLRSLGYRVGFAGNQTAALERWARDEGLPVDVIGSSASWGVEKPARAFFERMVVEAGCEPGEVAYVGDRIDNDVLPAAEAGLVPIHVRRGPWGMLQEEDAVEHLCVKRLSELPEVLHGI